MKSKLKSRLPEVSRDMGPRREPRRGSKPKLNKHLWEQISSEMREIDHPHCAPTSGGACLKSSRRLKERMGGGERFREEEENKEEKETKYKQNISKFHHFFVFYYVFLIIIFFNF